MEQLFQTIDGLKEKYLQFWVDICNIESPTASKEGVDAVGRFVAEKARELGWEIEISPQKVSGDAVCITMNPNAPGQMVVLSSHMDTVHPVGSFGTPAVRVEGDRIYGPAVMDCKGGIVVAFLAMEALQRCGFQDRPVRLLLQSDEEVGSSISNKATISWILEKAKGCIAFLNGEGASDDNKVTLVRKGILRYEFLIKGKAVHSSKCYNGASAIAEAAHKIIELEKWKEKDGVTCNCGIIHGGTTPNTVAEECTVIADIRYKTAQQAEEVKARLQEIAETSYIGGTTCELRQKSYRVAMEYTERTQGLLDRINEICVPAGFPKLDAGTSNGGSDAADATAAGLPSVDSLGVQGGRIHSVEEWALIPSLPAFAKRTALIIKEVEKE